MIGAREGDRQYRRGMVLGLTMAEIMLLLIFLLMLLLAAKLIDDREALAKAEKARDEAVGKYAELERTLHDLKLKDATRFDALEDLQRAEKKNEELEQQLAEAQSAMEILESVKKANPDMTDAEAKAEVERRMKVADAVEHQAAAMSPGKPPAEALVDYQQAALVGSQALKSGKSPEDLIAGASCQQDLDRNKQDLEICKKSNVDIAEQLARKGGDLPSCWFNEVTAERQYIFDAYLRDDGIYLTDNKVEGREAEQAELPIKSFQFRRAYTPQEFRSAGRALRDLSEQRECRFWVRAYDQTSNDKDRYVALKEQGVEQVFYVYKVKR